MERAAVPTHTATPAVVAFTAVADIPAEVAEVSWRDADQLHRTHAAAFTPAVHAAIAPYSWRHAGPAYAARYDEAGFLRTPDAAEPAPGGKDDLAQRVRSMADWLLKEQVSRGVQHAQDPPGYAAPVRQQTPEQHPRDRTPGR
ncbi:hypothetical protein ACF1AB_39260 [Streptomyces sp. NPDC014846]|uniref:hypothetical protein n=1 Tax=Streptomyces sp. NPDC014846 TaxID=3364922 RepID=UPI0036FEFC7A